MHSRGNVCSLNFRLNMPRRRSLSCDLTHFYSRELEPEFEIIRSAKPRSHSARKKSVQWSSDLEEVRYFVPKRSRSESIRRKIQKVKQKAEKLTDGPLKALNSFNETTGLKRLQYARTAHGRSCFSLDTNFQSFEEYERQWDKLFELARKRREMTAIVATG